MVVGDVVGDSDGGDVIAGVGDIVGNWALDLPRRTSRVAEMNEELVMVMF